MRLEHLAQAGLIVDQRAGDTVTDRAGLTGKARALHGADHVEFVATIGFDQRLLDHHAQHGTGEIDFLVAAIDGDLAGAGLHPDAGGGFLAAAGAIGAAMGIDLRLDRDLLGNGGFAVSEGLQVFQRVGGIGHMIRPVSCSWCSWPQNRPLRAPGPRGGARRRHRCAAWRAVCGPASFRAASSASRQVPARARGNDH